MAVTELDGASAETILDSAEIALITFSRAGCRACRDFTTVYEDASERHPDIAFCRVDTEREPDLARSFDVEAVPMTAVLREQILLLMQPGSIPEDAMEDLIERAKALDMDRLRRDIAEEDGRTEASR